MPGISSFVAPTPLLTCLDTYLIEHLLRPDFASFLPDFRESVVVVVALLGGRSDVGRVKRHVELFLDAGDGRGTSDSAGLCQVFA